jgi:hypothetical protein
MATVVAFADMEGVFASKVGTETVVRNATVLRLATPGLLFVLLSVFLFLLIALLLLLAFLFLPGGSGFLRLLLFRLGAFFL